MCYLGNAHHIAHLISDVLEPCLLSFTLGDHVCEPDIRDCLGVLKEDLLLPDDRLGE